MRILTAAQMRQVDRRTTEQFGISQAQLMENAAGSVFEVLECRYAPLEGRTISVLCGRGNNGGDGMALGRRLREAGADARVYLFAGASELKDLPRAQYRSLRERNVPVEEIHSESDWNRSLPAVQGSRCIVDALLGTGISKPLEGLLRNAVESINVLDLPVVSVDIPSGLLSDDIATAVICVQADVTVTFTAPKVGLVLSPNVWAAGELIVAAIGSPTELVEQCGSRLSLASAEMLDPFRQPRPLFSHKGDFGRVLVVSGSRGKSGAAMLAGLAALRAGAGLVTLAVPSSIQESVMAAAAPELMTEGLAATAQGTLASGAARQILRLVRNFDVLAIGPGLGTGAGTVSAVREVIERSPAPVVADADAINALALAGDRWRRRSPLVLTPHLGEMGRLLKRTAADVFRERIDLAREFAGRHRCHLVLKGFRTLTVDPGGEIWVNSSGNPGMATAGSGDVLTGVTAAFLARNLHRPMGSMDRAVAAAVYLHGAAGDLAAAKVGQESLVAGDIIEHLPTMLKPRQQV